MRKLRMLAALTATALAVVGSVASTATAAVEVSGGGVTLEGTMDIDHPAYTPDELYCQVDLTMDVDGTGAIDVTDVAAQDAYPSQPAGHCRWPDGQSEMLNDCEDAGWSGQILGPGDQWERPGDNQLVEYEGTGDFEAVISACMDWTDYFSAPPPILRFVIDTVYDSPPVPDHEVWSLPEQPLFFWAVPETGHTITGQYDGAEHSNIAIQSVE